MFTGWKPIEISSSNMQTPGAKVSYTVVLEGTVEGQSGQVVNISCSVPGVYVELPQTVVVPQGSDRVTFSASLALSLPSTWVISASCNGGTASQQEKSS